MKKILSMVVLAAAFAMVGCCGTADKKACETPCEQPASCEQCEAAPAEAPVEAPAEAPVEAPAEAPVAAPAE